MFHVIDVLILLCFFFQAEDGIRDISVTGVQTCALPISIGEHRLSSGAGHHPPAGRRVGNEPLPDQPDPDQPLPDQPLPLKVPPFHADALASAEPIEPLLQALPMMSVSPERVTPWATRCIEPREPSSVPVPLLGAKVCLAFGGLP